MKGIYAKQVIITGLIIVSFDKLLFNKEFARIEKIKVSFYFKNFYF